MTRSWYKPFYINNSSLTIYNKFIKIIKKRYLTARRNYKLLLSSAYARRFLYLLMYFKKSRLSGLSRVNILQPHGNDTILNINRFMMTWQVLAYSHPPIRSGYFYDQWVELIYYYKTSKYRISHKYGEVLKTRLYREFRWQVDKKKRKKYSHDIEKAEKKIRHKKIENTRLLSKALGMAKTHARLKRRVTMKTTQRGTPGSYKRKQVSIRKTIPKKKKDPAEKHLKKNSNT